MRELCRTAGSRFSPSSSSESSSSATTSYVAPLPPAPTSETSVSASFLSSVNIEIRAGGFDGSWTPSLMCTL